MFFIRCNVFVYRVSQNRQLLSHFLKVLGCLTDNVTISGTLLTDNYLVLLVIVKDKNRENRDTMVLVG